MDEKNLTLQIRVTRIPTYEDAEKLFEQVMESAQELGAKVQGGFYESSEEEEEENSEVGDNERENSKTRAT